MSTPTLPQLAGQRWLRARRAIRDSPLAHQDASARRGQLGELCDSDEDRGLLWVDFGDGAIACTADELAPTAPIITPLLETWTGR